MTIDLSAYHIEIGDTLDLVGKLNDALDAVESDVNAELEIVSDTANEVSANLALSETYKDASYNNMIAAQAAALAATDSTARIAAVLKTRGITNIKAIAFKSAEGWEKQGNQSYKNETRPTGRFLGDYANVAQAWAANVGGVASVNGDVYWDTTDKAQYELSGGNSRTINYRFGEHFPAEALIVLAGSEGSIRLIVFDMTDPLIPAYIIYAVASGSFLIGTGSAVVSDMVYDDGRVIYGISSVAGRGLRIIDYKNDRASWYLESTTYITKDILSGVRYPDWKFVGSGLSGSSSAALIKSIATHNGYFAAATAEGIAVIKPDGTVVKSSSTSPFLRVAILNGLLFAILDSSPDIVAGYGPVDSLGASFNANVSWTNATTPSLSATSFVGLQGSKDSLVVMSTSTHDILWPNPADYQSSLIARRGLYHATPPMKKPKLMLICGTTEGSVSDAELVTNGTFDSDITGWTAGGGGLLSLESGKLRITNDSDGFSHAYAVINCTVGKSYIVNATVSYPGTAYANRIVVDTETTFNAPNTAATTANTDTGIKTIKFVATAATMYVALQIFTATASAAVEFDNVSVKEIIEDFSGLANHGTIHGGLTASAEVTGGVALLSGFTSNTNYVDSANPWDGVGSGSAYISGVFKFSSSGVAEVIATISHYSGGIVGSYVEIYLKNTSEVSIEVSNNPGVSMVSATSASPYDDGLLHHFTFRKTSTHYDLWIDSKKVASVAVGSHGTLAFDGSALLRIGRGGSGGTVAPNLSIAFVSAGKTLLSDAEIELTHKHMRNLIESKAALGEIPTTAAYNEQEGSVELLGTTYRQRVKDGAIVSSAAHGVGSTPVVAVGARGEVAFGGSTGITVSVPERNLREYQARKTVERFTVTYTGDSSRTTFPDPTDDAEMLVTRGAKPVNVWDDANHLTEGASDDYTVDDYGLGAYVAEIAVAPGANPVVIEFEREVWK